MAWCKNAPVPFNDVSDGCLEMGEETTEKIHLHSTKMFTIKI